MNKEARNLIIVTVVGLSVFGVFYVKNKRKRSSPKTTPVSKTKYPSPLIAQPTDKEYENGQLAMTAVRAAMNDGVSKTDLTAMKAEFKSDLKVVIVEKFGKLYAKSTSGKDITHES